MIQRIVVACFCACLLITPAISHSSNNKPFAQFRTDMDVSVCESMRTKIGRTRCISHLGNKTKQQLSHVRSVNKRLIIAISIIVFILITINLLASR